MKLKDLLAGTDLRCLPGQETICVMGIKYDSRKVEKGDLFVCFSGEGMDEPVFVKEAEKRGSAAIIAEKMVAGLEVPLMITDDSRKSLSKIAANYYGNPSLSMVIFGITGTNGKTTISYMVKSIMEGAGYPCGVIGTIGYDLIEKRYDPANTTPEAPELEKMLKEMCEVNIKYCAMEVSSHGLKLSRTDDIKFDYTVFTNLTREHLDFHHDMEEYYQAKKKLFIQGRDGAIINVDDPGGLRLQKEIKAQRGSSYKVISYSLKDKKADFYGEIARSTEKGSVMEIFSRGSYMGKLWVPIPGVFMAYNGLASLSCCSLAGISFDKIREGIKNLRPVPGRFELVENHRGYLIIIDYAHTPDALEKALGAVADIVKGRLICVFGCGGDRDRDKRPMMGRIAGTYSDYCIITSDNPRGEKQEEIAAQIEEGIYETHCIYEIIDDRKEAIRRAIDIYEKGDAILIAGKGHEDYQIIGDKKIYFSDRKTVESILSEG